MSMMGGIRPEQGPPLKVPISFFVLGALGLMAAGILLAALGSQAFANRYMPGALALTHLLTIGFLGSIMLGALYQMVPVVAGRPVPAMALGPVTAVTWAGGAGALVTGFLSGSNLAFIAAMGLLGAALLAFIIPLGLALARAPTKSATVTGLKIAATALIVVACLGLFLAWVRSGATPSVSLTPVWNLHVGLGTLVWMAGLILAVSWQVLPMFFTAKAFPKWGHRASLIASGLSIVGGLAAWAFAPELSVAVFVPSAVLVFGVTPVVWVRQLRGRKRRRADASMRFWFVACAMGPIVGVSWGLAWWSYTPHWQVLAAWLFLMGWAGIVVHGMLTRIVPFLVWFHRFSGQIGKEAVPPMRKLWPQPRVRRGLQLHLATVVVGAVAIVTRSDLAARFTGAGLLLLGAWLIYGIHGAFRTTSE